MFVKFLKSVNITQMSRQNNSGACPLFTEEYEDCQNDIKMYQPNSLDLFIFVKKVNMYAKFVNPLPFPHVRKYRTPFCVFLINLHKTAPMCIFGNFMDNKIFI